MSQNVITLSNSKATTDLLASISDTYVGDDIEHTSSIAETIGKAITSKANAALKNGNEVGAILRKVRDSGLAVASTGGTEFTNDDRTTAVSAFMKAYAPKVDQRRYAEWLQAADSLADLASKGIDGSVLSPSVHRKRAKTVTAAQWATAVKKATKKAEAKSKKVPTATMVAAELPNAKPRNGKATTTTEASVILTHVAPIMVALGADDVVLTEPERTALSNLIKAIAELG